MRAPTRACCDADYEKYSIHSTNKHGKDRKSEKLKKKELTESTRQKKKKEPQPCGFSRKTSHHIFGSCKRKKRRFLLSAFYLSGYIESSSMKARESPPLPSHKCKNAKARIYVQKKKKRAKPRPFKEMKRLSAATIFLLVSSFKGMEEVSIKQPSKKKGNSSSRLRMSQLHTSTHSFPSFLFDQPPY